MKHIRKPVGIFDKYNHGKVVHIDFTYRDWTVVWVQYKRITRAYLFVG